MSIAHAFTTRLSIFKLSISSPAHVLLNCLFVCLFIFFRVGLLRAAKLWSFWSILMKYMVFKLLYHTSLIIHSACMDVSSERAYDPYIFGAVCLCI